MKNNFIMITNKNNLQDIYYIYHYGINKLLIIKSNTNK